MEKIQTGSYLKWEELGGTKHEGFVKEMDSNLAIVDCIEHKKECCCDNC